MYALKYIKLIGSNEIIIVDIKNKKRLFKIIDIN